jgi:hypothetical protein
MDYYKKEVGVGAYFTPTGQIDADFEQISAFYSDKVGRHPSKQSPIRLRSKDKA